MSPQSIDPSIDYRRLHQLSDEFIQHWQRLQAFYIDAVAGFAFVLSHVESEQELARGFVRGTELDLCTAMSAMPPLSEGKRTNRGHSAVMDWSPRTT